MDKIYGNKGVESFAGFSKPNRDFNYEREIDLDSPNYSEEVIKLNKEWLMKILRRLESKEIYLTISKKSENSPKGLVLSDDEGGFGLICEIVD